MRAAVVGVGFMGWIHYLAYQQSAVAEMVAFCSRDPRKRAGDWRAIRGNFGPSGEQIDVAGINVYQSIDEIVADDTIDLVDICLPTHLHPDAVRQCLAAGKRVLCEKPLALDAATAHALARDAKPGQLMVAHVLPWIPEFKLLVDAASDGRWGKPIAGRFKRTIAPPDWNPDFYDPSQVGGPLIDLHIHDAHLIRLLFGMPTKAHCVNRIRHSVPAIYETVFEFDQPGLVVSSGGGVIESSARPFNHGYEVSFENATVYYEFAAFADAPAATIPVTVLHNDGQMEQPNVSDKDPVGAFLRQIDAAAKWFHEGASSAVLDADTAVDALRICELQR